MILLVKGSTADRASLMFHLNLSRKRKIWGEENGHDHRPAKQNQVS